MTKSEVKDVTFVGSKPMPGIGGGVCEIRIHDEAGAFRVIYVASFLEAVYILHAFQKKSRATTKKDIALAKTRYQKVVAKRIVS